MSTPIIPPIPARLVDGGQDAAEKDAAGSDAVEGESGDDQATVDRDVAEARESSERLDD